MVDIRIRKNERCVIGLPSCDYVFSSTRSCFIAYGFSTSALEMEILKALLEHKGVEPVEAGTDLAPGKFVFCTKICAKIIAAQFCIVLINEDTSGPNANVNMEYGLMLGHNKYVIPLQREADRLPFNVAGLDTVKYNQGNFKRLAGAAIDKAMQETVQNQPVMPFDNAIEIFLLTKNTTVVNLQMDAGDRQIYELGKSFGFNLLTKFDGLSYVFLGNFRLIPARGIIWRVSRLIDMIEARIKAIPSRIAVGLAAEASLKVLSLFLQKLEIWLIVASENEEIEVRLWLENRTPPPPFPFQIFPEKQVSEAVNQLP